MNIGTRLVAVILAVQSAASGLSSQRRRERLYDLERGDVPGWVMITLMSAVLVAGLLALAGPALETMFNEAMNKVGN